MEIKLDRVVMDRNFNKLTNLEKSTSDHCQVFFDHMKVSHVVFIKVFRFENAWFRESMCRKIMKEIRYKKQRGSLQEKVKECSKILTVWGNEITGSFKSQINQRKSII